MGLREGVDGWVGAGPCAGRLAGRGSGGQLAREESGFLLGGKMGSESRAADGSRGIESQQRVYDEWSRLVLKWSKSFYFVFLGDAISLPPL